ncbi:hypothetical protein F6V30_00295 [Oryzomonas sagensis]|uniref:HNH endonuclease n=1 Tax=Oryzomonas sagensis TaxID=2603857 RepID=A0ABQ6TQR9_9BACT|nr:hypothetical protein [Oryzomonas sagensis]KAB0671067.1 hypothetical protein F6V30_00295 [Oryzomonas sagensis]
MPRKHVKSSTQAAVLVRARRRCCICFGLNRDTTLKQGQIAHLDQNPANDVEDNLAFLCFNHHNQYDSTYRQSKNFTIDEVKHFREELHEAIRRAFSVVVSFGEAQVNLSGVSGHYIRGGEYESADLTIQRLDNGQYHVSGLALWGTTREFGPNIGELDFIAELKDDMIIHTETFLDRTYCVVLRFIDDYLTVTEQSWAGMFGLNVNFSGEYRKAT